MSSIDAVVVILAQVDCQVEFDIREPLSPRCADFIALWASWSDGSVLLCVDWNCRLSYHHHPKTPAADPLLAELQHRSRLVISSRPQPLVRMLHEHALLRRAMSQLQ